MTPVTPVTHVTLVTPVRRFKVPTLNFNATDCVDLFNWMDYQVSVSPILLDMSEEQLQGLVTGHCLNQS